MISATGNSFRKRRQSGYTLLELVVAGSVLALITSLSWPALRHYSRTIVARAEANAFAHELFTAREQAIHSGTTQYVRCPTSGSSAQGVFFADGSAQRAQFDFVIDHERAVKVLVDESGRIDVIEA